MFYTHGRLDRADHLRRDETALRGLRQQASTRLIPVWRGNVLVTDGDAAQPVLASLPVGAEVPATPPVWLGLVDEIPYFAINCSALSDEESLAVARQATPTGRAPSAARFSDLRVVGPLLPANEGALLAFARGMNHWHENTRHCARCGHPLRSQQGGHVLACTHEPCGRHEFPRTDPAVIMLVTSPETGAAGADHDNSERCLLGRSPAWPDGVYSTLAGFVEPGETLEQAVRREVFEEAGIRTEAETYIASQPWPFPRSIMLGFESRALNSDITIDPKELADAAWFSRGELREFGTWGDERYTRQLPRTDSIARFLIDRWLDGD